MTIEEIRNKVQMIFRGVFDDDTLLLRDDMTASDVDGWDSLTHVNLIIAIEKSLGIRFATAEMSRMSDQGQNVGSLLELIKNKLS